MKIERLINIIMLLLENDTISANSLAQRFGVSKRTILRDMDSLILAQGPKGGFGIMDSYKFNKRLLTEFDIQNILIALSGLSEFTADKETALTIDKLKSLLPNKMNNLKTLMILKRFMKLSPLQKS
jgi:predicted DNA-binding transcriptional regulator YafY